MRKVRLIAVFSLIAILSACAGSALHHGENLTYPRDKNFKITGTKQNEYVKEIFYGPASNSSTYKGEGLLVQVLLNLKNVPAASYLDSYKKLYQSKCEDFNADTWDHKKENGYPTSQLLLTCPRQRETGQGSLHLLRTYSGNDSFYIVLRTWEGAPFSRERMPISTKRFKEWTNFFAAVTVCDARGTQHPCREYGPKIAFDSSSRAVAADNSSAGQSKAYPTTYLEWQRHDTMALARASTHISTLSDRKLCDNATWTQKHAYFYQQGKIDPFAEEATNRGLSQEKCFALLKAARVPKVSSDVSKETKLSPSSAPEKKTETLYCYSTRWKNFYSSTWKSCSYSSDIIISKEYYQRKQIPTQ
jgi:hypothetical protein